MRKSLIALLCVLFILVSSVYLFIPSKLTIRAVTMVHASPQGLFRVLTRDSSWARWWPGTINHDSAGNTKLTYKDFVFVIHEKKISSIELALTGDAIQAKSSLNFFPINQDSVELAWEVQGVQGNRLPARINGYFKARRLQATLHELLARIGSFYAHNENIYDHEIRNVLVTDSILVSTYGQSNPYPSTAFIYGLIDELRAFTRKNSIRETGSPMLNITRQDTTKYLVRVAIPVDKRVADEGKIAYKWMMGRGHILVSDVRGGPKTIDNTLLQMQHYILDYGRSAAAIPFQSLVTDRRTQPDTAAWVTRVFYPVM